MSQHAAKTEIEIDTDFRIEAGYAAGHFPANRKPTKGVAR